MGYTSSTKDICLAAALSVYSLLPASLRADAHGELGFDDVARLTPAEAVDPIPCAFTGVVTLASSWLDLAGIVARTNDPNGKSIWMHNYLDPNVKVHGADRLAAGQIVSVRGSVSQLGFAPGVKISAVEVIGRMDLPEPPLMRLRDFDWGVNDNHRAKMRGTLIDACVADENCVRLLVGSPDGEFVVRIPGTNNTWSARVDAEIEAVGAAMSVFNIRGEYLGVQLETTGAGGVRELRAPPDAGALRETPLREILGYSPRPPDGHRRLVRGTVTFARDGEFFCIVSGESSLRVQAAARGIRPGDVVEAVGFPRMVDGIGRLDFAMVRKTGESKRPEPVEIGALELEGYHQNADAGFEHFDSCLARVRGRLISAVRTAEGAQLTLELRHQEFSIQVNVVVDGETPLTDPEEADLHPLVSATGIVSARMETSLPVGRKAEVRDWTLLVESPEDVVVVPDAEWVARRRARRVRSALAIFGIAALATLAAALVKILRDRGVRRRLTLLAEERKRMASDLHDTVEQNIASARMVLNTAAEFEEDLSPAMKKAVDDADAILARTKDEMRDRIWNLRSDVLYREGPKRAMEGIAARFSKDGAVRVRTAFRAIPEHIAENVFSELTLIVQEAIGNAIKHGHAKNVILATDPSPNGRGWIFSIANDGEPFDADVAAMRGAKEGHFGIAGMRERAARSGFTFSIERRGRLTVVKLETKR